MAQVAKGPNNFAVAEFSQQADNFTVTLGTYFEQEFAPINLDYRHLSSAQNSSSLSRPGVLVCAFLSCPRTSIFISFESQQQHDARQSKNALLSIAFIVFVVPRVSLLTPLQKGRLSLSGCKAGAGPARFP